MAEMLHAPITPGRPTAPLWIASYPDGGMRLPIPGRGRVHVSLEPSSYLVDASGGIEWAQEDLRALGGGYGQQRKSLEYTLEALVIVSDRD